MDENHNNCVMCQRGFYNGRFQRHPLRDDLLQNQPAIAAYVQASAVLEVTFNGSQFLCHRCWQRTLHAIRIPLLEEQIVIDPVASLHIADYRRAPNTAVHCIYNNCQNNSRCRIPEEIKIFLLRNHKLYVPDSARVCQEHLNSNVWDELHSFCDTLHDFTSDYISNICDLLLKAVEGSLVINFEEEGAISDEVMRFWTGRNNEQFNLVLQETPSLNNTCKKPRSALGMYLIKLRTGESNVRIASQFRISERSVRRKIKTVRECLQNEFVSRHLGFDSINRNDVLQRNLMIPKGLFGNEQSTIAIIICDGTYTYIQKSSNFLFQRLTYSLHKFDNLLKPFLIVCTDGYIIDALGPFPATTSDATIMSRAVNNEEGVFNWFFEENDVLILDRGFRDCVPDLESCGYQTKIPPTKQRNETQLTTEEANKSRLVSICRWVVEVVNGRINRDFKLLRQDYFNSTLRNLFPDFRIASALTNAFHVPIADNINAVEMLDAIVQRMHLRNHLYDYVNERNINRQRVIFNRLNANDPHLEQFPRLTENDVAMIALGSYHIKLAKSYCGEHITDGLYLIEIHQDDALADLNLYNMPQNSWLLRVRMQSRHVRARTYYSYILVERGKESPGAICQYYCSCLTGRRTVGSCAHIISVVWYLGFGRYQPFRAPAADLLNVIVDEEI